MIKMIRRRVCGDRLRGREKKLVRHSVARKKNPVVPMKIYADYFRTLILGSYSPAKDKLEEISGYEVTQLLPSSVADLSDCEIYCLGCFGRANGVFPQGQVMTLDATQRGVVADWVNAGGKLLCCVDYRNLYDSGGFLQSRNVDSSFYTQLATLISNAGGSLTFGAEDAVTPTTTVPWPTAAFLSDSWTTGITGQVEYDSSAGSSITGGTQLFAPVSKNTIVKQQCGSGWVICYGSTGPLWGNQDVSQSSPTGYVAVGQFLEFLWNL
jgi:hypothetical protein